MDDQILSRESIAQDADLAAQRCVAHGVEQPCPHQEGTEAALIWRNAFHRYLLLHSAPDDVEGSA
jgi:hypothetical protein